MAEEYLTVREAAAVLRVDKQTVYRLVWAGELPRTDIGTGKRPRFRIPRTGVDRFMRKRTKGAAA